jgi:hypothetical protein
VVGEGTGKKLIKKLQMQHIQTLKLGKKKEKKNVTQFETEHIIQQLSV